MNSTNGNHLNRPVKSTWESSLVEILVLLLVLGLLAMTVVPQYLKASTLSKVAEVKQSLGMLATVLENYAIDNDGRYPFDLDSRGWPWYLTDVLSTPIAYIQSDAAIWNDPFTGSSALNTRYRYFNYEANRTPGWPPCPFPGPYLTRWITGQDSHWIDTRKEFYGEWALVSRGPDELGSFFTTFPAIQYDPTNGVISNGDIFCYELSGCSFSSGLSNWRSY